MRETGTHSLEIDQISLAVSDQNILRLKIAMHQNARQLRQLLGDFAEGGKGRQLVDLRRLDFEITTEAVLEKVTLFPPIKRGIEFRRQLLMHLDANRFGQLMELAHFVEGRIVKSAANEPRFIAIAEKVALAQILDPDQTFLSIMIINPRRVNAVRLQKLRDLDVMTVIFALEIIFNENER